jgi:hypothetical protein
LEIYASDPIFNNTRTYYYKIGYDASILNIELHGPPTNGSTINGGDMLNFSVYYIDTATYEWDQNGTQFPFLDPYDIITPLYEEDHNLTIRTTDFYMSETIIYFFTFDSDPPTILLDNVVNGSTYAPQKTIDVRIFDLTGIKNVKYHWDSEANSTWNPYSGDIYRTNLPITDGNHFLYVYAFDNYNHPNSKVYYFYADSNVFLVELQDLTNNSYYQGGETVKITIQKSNGTVRYQWDGGLEKDGTIVSSTLTLEGSEGIPLTASQHILTIITFDISNVLQIFSFVFIVDLEAPIIDTDIVIYNNSRFLNTQLFIFNVTDNYVSGSDLIVLISVDGKANKLLNNPYQLSLEFFEDGQHNFYLYAIDVAGNIDVKFIVFFVDTTAPSVTVVIPELIDFTIIDGNKYVPYHAEVIVTYSDDDPLVITSYYWNNPPYVSFTNSFFLDYSEEQAILRIKVSDSLDNFLIYSITLILDQTPPTISLTNYENETTIINYETILEFETQDLSDKTIEIIKYSWDKLPGFWYESSTADFTLSVLPIYSHNSIAKFYVLTKDIVGNSFMYTFSFIIDIQAPIIDLQIYDAAEKEWLDASSVYYIQSRIEIVYNDSANDDLYLFQYAWNWNGDEEDLYILDESDSWTILAPDFDGSHNLTVILTDETAGSFPNKINQTLDFLVDNIVLNFQNSDFTETAYAYENSTSLIYGDSVSYVLNVTDAINNTEIIGLQYNIIKNLNLNISVDIIKLDNITYAILITATNITQEIPTKIEIQFYKFAESKQLIWIYLNISKKEGNLIIDSSRSILNVIYEQNFTILLNLNNDLGENETVLLIILNGNIEVADFISLQDGYFQFNYSSKRFGSKGNFSLGIYVESNFFKSQSTIDVEIDPLDVQLSVEVSGYEIIEGSQLIITGQLTLINGTSISLADITISIYIKEKENGKSVFAFDTAEYDRNETTIATTDFDGFFQAIFQMNDEIDYIDIEANYFGNDIYGITSSVLDAPVYSIPPPGLPSWLLYTIIGGSLAIALVVSIIIYKVTRRKPFMEFLESISDDEVENYYSIISPGVVISIFDQRKGPVPLVMDHSLKLEKYSLRLRMGTENFLLKISDQAYSSLGFEEHDVGRRVGSIVLPSEKMIGWVQGIQLPNPSARGGFENLSLIVLADSEYGNYLLNYQEYLYDEVDKLNVALKSKKELTKIDEILEAIRKKSVRIVLAAQKMDG